jgi:tetraacyldisaccharide 4'-kinase
LSARDLLAPLGPLYEAGSTLRRRLYDRRVIAENRLRLPVVSVGSVSAGGAGKTPMALLVAKMLQGEGFGVDILSRGYGRDGDEVERVELSDPSTDAARYGDEPVLLAQRSGVPVYVGADRFLAGKLAEDELPEGARGAHILDDGFQHWGLARDVDIVLLTMKDLEDRPLPAGDLRESLDALRRADIVVLREEEAALAAVVEHMARDRRGSGDERRSLTEVSSERGAKPDLWVEARPAIWVVRRKLSFGGLRQTDFPGWPILFCGIARPEGFGAMLATAGCKPVEQIAFRDHHAYTDRDITGLIELAARCAADGFVTTEKDAVKLAGPMRERLEGVGPMIVPQLRVEFAGPDEERRAATQLIALLERGKAPR